ncbi:MAG TPA: SGNH/GDSL hydrolase family protein [Chitinophagaceae bacterium]|nr:SGNH/GDSL hydrolase family protein [Chitinophagaceae bacterium]
MRYTLSVPSLFFIAIIVLLSSNSMAQCTDSSVLKYALHPPPGVSAYDVATKVFRCFIHSSGSQLPAAAADKPVITAGTFSPSLRGAAVSPADNRIRYIGGHTVESFANVQPGNYPASLFTTAKNVSFSATERSAIGSIVEFDLTCPRFEIFEYESGGAVRVLIDNKIAGAYNYRSAGDLNYRLFDFTAINAKPVKRHVRLEYSGKSVMGGLQLDTIGSLLPLEDKNNYRICWLGDSFTEGTGVANTQTPHEAVAAYASKLLGFSDYRLSGLGGTGYSASYNPGFGSVRPSLFERVQYDGVAADVFVVALGLNDMDTDTSLSRKITASLDKLRAANQASLIYVLGPYGNGRGENIKANVEQKIISAAANRPGVSFISVYDIAFTKSDTTHPDPAGHVTLGKAIAARIQARVDAADSLLTIPDTSSGGTTNPPTSFSAKIGPNPVRQGEDLRLQINSTQAGEGTLTIISNTGIRLFRQRLTLIKGANNTPVHTARLTQGLYLVNINNGSASITLKIVVH